MKELIFEGLGIMYMLAVIVMITVAVAICIDFVSGWRKAKLRGDEHTSYAASRTFTKILIYESIMFGITLCIVEAWSVREKADKKQRKRMDDAAQVIASILDKETVLELLKSRLRESQIPANRTILDKDDN